jgi:hypothetical protein
MYTTSKKHLIGLALALGIGAAAADAAPEGAMGTEAFEAAQARVEAQAKAQRKACGRLEGLAKDVCEAEARGREKIALARLEAQRTPGPEAEKNIKFAKAEADYAIAKQRCRALKERAKDSCTARAKHDREAAIRLAKVEKVQEEKQLARDEEREAKRPAATPRS